MRASMLLPVATAVAQLKWTWFRSARTLYDLERFDDASRGILGSVKLILFLRGRHVAAVGAALTILALPLDALIQSAVMLPSKLVVNNVPWPGYGNITNSTTLARSTWYNEAQAFQSSDEPWPTTPMINAIRFGESYSNGPSAIIEAVTRVQCPTGICTFPRSQTLTISGRCVDRTRQIVTKKDGRGVEYRTLPGTSLRFNDNDNSREGKQIIVTESYNAYPSEIYAKDIFGSDPGPLIVRTAMLADQGDSGILGIECRLVWTVLTFDAYVNATSNYTYASSSSDIDVDYKLSKNSTQLWEITPQQCFVEGQRILNDSTSSVKYKNECVYRVGRSAGLGLQAMLLDDTDGFTGTSIYLGKFKNGTRKWSRTNSFVTNVYEATWEKERTVGVSDLKTMWGNIAFTTSFTIRQSLSESIAGSRQRLYVRGTVHRLIYLYEIDWARLAMPAFIVVCSALFVLYTAVLTRKEHAWRRSTLPLLFHGLEDHERYAQGDLRDFATMQNVALRLRVRLIDHADANGAKLVAAHG